MTKLLARAAGACLAVVAVLSTQGTAEEPTDVTVAQTAEDATAVGDTDHETGDSDSPVCFASHEELRQAVNFYVDRDGSPGSSVALRYGWPIGSWCVSSVDRFDRLFAGKHAFDEELSDWDVSNGTSFRGMFHGASAFNRPLESWNMTNARILDSMFRDAATFDQPLDAWTLTPGVVLDGIFRNASSFRQNLCAWGNVLSTESSCTGMFGATACPNTADPLPAETGVYGPLCFVCDERDSPSPLDSAQSAAVANGTNNNQPSDRNTPSDVSTAAFDEKTMSESTLTTAPSANDRDGLTGLESVGVKGFVDSSASSVQAVALPEASEPRMVDQSVESEQPDETELLPVTAVTTSEVERMEPSADETQYEPFGDYAAGKDSEDFDSHDDLDSVNTEEPAGRMSMDVMKMVHFRLIISFMVILCVFVVVVLLQKYKHSFIRGIDPSAHALPEFETLTVEEA